MKNDKLYKEVIRFCIKNENRFGIFCFRHAKLTFSVEKNKFCHIFFIDKDDRNRKIYIDLLRKADPSIKPLLGITKYVNQLCGLMILFYNKRNSDLIDIDANIDDFVEYADNSGYLNMIIQF